MEHPFAQEAIAAAATQTEKKPAVGQALYERKVSLALMASVVTVSLLYTFGSLQDIPCGKDPGSTFARNFIHTSPGHLVANLWGLFVLAPLEVDLGPLKFIGLVTMILAFSTLMEWILSHWVELKCSIGLSGLLYGLFTWSLLARKKVNWLILSAIVLQMLIQGATDKSISWSGHLLGAFAGVLAVPITKALF